MNHLDAVRLLRTIRGAIGPDYKAAIRAAWATGQWEGLEAWRFDLETIRTKYGEHWLQFVAADRSWRTVGNAAAYRDQ